MKSELTKQDILELLDKQAKEFNRQMLESHKGLDESLRKSRAEFDKRLGELGGSWGKFVSEMVRPKIIELFREKGIAIQTSVQNVTGYIDDEKYYEIDLLLINAEIAVVVEIKSSLSVEDVREHLKRMEKIKKIQPKRINLSGVKLYGAIAGMVVEGDADRYAYKKGLFVLRQKGNMVEIVNDDNFVPKEWKVNY